MSDRPGRPLRIGIIATLAMGLHELGHEITLFGPGDSSLPFETISVVPQSLWRTGHVGDASAYLEMAVAKAWAAADRFDVIHSHVERARFIMARYCATPVVSTLH